MRADLRTLIREVFFELVEKNEIEVTSSETENEPDEENPEGGQEPLEPIRKANPADGEEDGEEVSEPDPSDAEISQDVEDLGDQDSDGDSLSKILHGAQVSGIEYEKKSKVLPGAQHIKVTFEDRDYPLFIVITKSGMVRFMYKNAIHSNI